MSAIEELIAQLSALPKDVQAALAKETQKLDIGPYIPFPGRQTEAYYCQADELFFGGGAGGGKSFLAVGLPLNEHHNSLVFRHDYKQTLGLVDAAVELLGSRDGYNGQEKLFRLPGGKTLEFGSMPHEWDKEKYQGRAHDFLAFDEITHFLESQYRFVITWCRSTRPGQRCRVLAGGNPPLTEEGLWVIQYWGPWLDPSHPNPAEPGELRWFTTVEGQDKEVDGPGPHMIGGVPDRARSRTFIPALLEDNPALMATGYAATLEAMREPMRTMMRKGRFDLQIKQVEDSIIPVQWIMAAQARWKPDGGKDIPMSCIGFDPAGGGKDEATLAARHGGWFAPVVAMQGEITSDGSLAAAEIIKRRRDRCPVVVDLGGGYGGAVKMRLDDNGVEIIGFDGSRDSIARAHDGSGFGFANKRAEAWWRFREALEPGKPNSGYVALPPDPKVRADLCAPRWKLTKNGVLLEDKQSIRTRIGRSPDRGDAVVMAYTEGVSEARAKRLFPRVYDTSAVVANRALKERLRVGCGR